MLDSRSGYPAGIRDPRWQQAIFTAAAIRGRSGTPRPVRSPTCAGSCGPPGTPPAPARPWRRCGWPATWRGCGTCPHRAAARCWRR
ncbi:DUF5682 family protein [Streptosporangium lutulentum]